MYAQRIIEDINSSLPATPYLRPGGSLLIMVGLPGAGKSYIVDHVHDRLKCTVIRTDHIRRHVRQQPTYTPAEMTYIYEICYGLVDERLSRGERVIFDGSNYLAARRRRLLEVAAWHRSAVAICHVQASEAVTRQRLRERIQGDTQNGDLSDAGWSVYQWMVEAQEPVAVPHVTLDTTDAPPNTLVDRLIDYWAAREEEAGAGDRRL